MTIPEIARLANLDGAPTPWLTKLAQCTVTAESPDLLELEGPEEMVHDIGILGQRPTRMGGVTHNPWSHGICCTRANGKPWWGVGT